MSHTGNWHRSPRKMALELARQRERGAQEGASREIVFVASDPKLLTLHPCATKARSWYVRATCTCGARRAVDLEPLLTTFLAHAPWPRVMRHMRCGACGGQPVELAFSYRNQDLHLAVFGTIRVRLL